MPCQMAWNSGYFSCKDICFLIPIVTCCYTFDSVKFMLFLFKNKTHGHELLLIIFDLALVKKYVSKTRFLVFFRKILP